MPRASTNSRTIPSKITPLWIVAAFVTLTETVLGMALTRVNGGVQVALTCFVILFALLVAGGFFLILWNRPYVFYSPGEYGNTDPKGFIEAMRGRIPEVFAEQVIDAEAMLQDDSATFSLIDSLIDESIRQHMILMRIKNVQIPFDVSFLAMRFETGKAETSWSSGGISASEITKKLGGSGLVAVDPLGPAVGLTDLGKKFADWLISKGRQNDFYASPLGGWGEVKRPPDLPKGFVTKTVGVPQESSASPSRDVPQVGRSDI
jgi:hypothetical protein